MSENDDPPRLADGGGDASPKLRSLLGTARELPSASDLAGVAAKLGPLLLAAPVLPAAASSGKSLLVKAGLGAAGGLALAGGIWLATRAEPRPPAPPARPMASLAAPPVVETRAAPVATPELAAPSAAAEAASVAARGGVDKAGRAPSARGAAVTEDVLLEQARRALAADPKRALSLTREHELSYPGGVLAQEREVIAIEALKRLGRSAEADKRRERFERLFPGSAHRRKLEVPPAQP